MDEFRHEEFVQDKNGQAVSEGLQCSTGTLQIVVTLTLGGLSLLLLFRSKTGNKDILITLVCQDSSSVHLAASTFREPLYRCIVNVILLSHAPDVF